MTSRSCVVGAIFIVTGLLLSAAPGGALQPAAPVLAATGDSACEAPGDKLHFEEAIIDETRAGGEPIVTTLDDGTLLWGSHAGTTHFYGPEAPDPDTAAFLQNYQGQTYQYFSEDNGETWEFVPRPPTPEPEQAVEGLPASGFSDPEFAIDAAGNVYISEINLANIAVSKSTNGGRSYGLVNAFAFTSTDRQWMEADAENVLYMTGNGFGGGTFPRDAVGTLGHFFAKSTDGGRTWSQAIQSNPNGVADIHIDPRDGALYEISAARDGTLSMAAFRNIRNENGPEASNFSDPDIHTIATGVGYGPIQRLIDPTFDMDADGNMYIVWSENGTGDAGRAAGIWYSYSTDLARNWADPIRVDPDEKTEIWPWLAVDEVGRVAIVYLATDAVLENNDAEQAEDDDGWNVVVADSLNGLGCDASPTPGFRLTQASSEPVHYGTICQGGTVCQAELVDRRLGDYFANEIDGQGNIYISVSNTTAGGAVALPMVIRQVDAPVDPGPGDTDDGVDDTDDGGPGALPATGGGALVALGVLLLVAGLIVRRRLGSEHS